MIFDSIIIGGGVIGMMTARELATTGAKIALFDSKGVGQEASWAAGGILSSMRPWAESPATVQLSEMGKKLYPDYVQALLDETGIDSEYIQSGLIISARDHAEKTRAWAKEGNIRFEENIQNISDNINLSEHSILLPEIAQLRPPRLLKALHQSLKKSDISIFENTKITDIIIKKNLFQGVNFSGGEAFAKSGIITAGAWSEPILESFKTDITTKPIRGQIICMKSRDKILDNIILEDAHYLIPRKDGHILIGSTMEDVGFVNETTKEARKELLDWAYTVLPALKQAMPVSQWSGLRPSTKMNKPLIGPIQGIKNLYLNTGHFRKGILQAPSSARLLVDNLIGRDSFMDIENFNP